MAQENSLKPIAGEESEYMAFTPNQYTQTIWNYLTQTGGLTEEGAAGLMGNMWAESNCTPYACQPSRPKNTCEIYIENVDNNRITRTQFADGGCSSSGTYTSTRGGFGLCQWTIHERKLPFHKYIFPNYPTMGGNTIGDIYKQLEYIMLELTGNDYNIGVLNYSSVGNVLMSSHDIDACSDICLEVYENPTDQSQAVHETRRQYAQQVYAVYGSGQPVTTLHIYLNVEGNGSASVSDTTPQAGDTITLTCIPAQNESLTDIIATTVSGQSVAIDPSLLVQSFPMPNESIIIYVIFTGIAPTPTKYKRHKMPIWMYPCIKKRR